MCNMYQMTVYYNEFDPKAAAWLRALIAERLIPDGPVDEGDIRDIVPTDLAGFRQCHFFAGIGGWPLALRLAGWPDDRPVWTGSCPCQPFSQAGRREGLVDERHLWPSWFHLIEQCCPPVVLGEQVASKAAIEQWFDGLVAPDLEGIGYAVAAADLPAAGVGAPHIRQRLYWVADCFGSGLEVVCEQPARQERAPPERGGEASWLADAGGGRSPARGEATAAMGHGHPTIADGCPDRTRPNHGGWDGADWLGCRDGAWRPVKSSVLGVADGLLKGMVPSGAFVPASSPLAEKQECRVMRLRGYGNAITPQCAQAFIEACLSI